MLKQRSWKMWLHLVIAAPGAISLNGSEKSARSPEGSRPPSGREQPRRTDLDQVWAALGQLGPMSAKLGPSLAKSRTHLGQISSTSLDRVRAKLDRVLPNLDRLREDLYRMPARFRPSSTKVGPSWANFGPMPAQFGPSSTKFGPSTYKFGPTPAKCGRSSTTIGVHFARNLSEIDKLWNEFGQTWGPNSAICWAGGRPQAAMAAQRRVVHSGAGQKNGMPRPSLSFESPS